MEQTLQSGEISVIINEVGRFFIPVINSDERQWTWMDEGLTHCAVVTREQTGQQEGTAGSVNYMRMPKDV